MHPIRKEMVQGMFSIPTVYSCYMYRHSGHNASSYVYIMHTVHNMLEVVH